MSDLFENIGGRIVPRDICARKHGGNEQSVSAFRTIFVYMTKAQRRVYREIRFQGALGATVEELSDNLNTTPNAISGRITELRMKGKIEKSGTRKTRSGCSAAVWKAV